MDRHLFAGAIKGTVNVKTILAGRRRVGDHVIGQMPFTKMRRSITAILQDPGQERRPGVEPIGHVAPGITGHPGKVAIDIVARREMPCHDRRTAGGTNPAGNGKPMKVSSLPGQAVNIGRLHIRVAMATQIPPAPVIGKNEEDLKVISAYLQDSIVTVKDIVFLEKNRTVVMMVNRFILD